MIYRDRIHKLSPQQVAYYCGVKETTVYGWVKEGIVPSNFIGENDVVDLKIPLGNPPYYIPISKSKLDKLKKK